MLALGSENCVYLSEHNSYWRPDSPLACIIFLSISNFHSYAFAVWPEFSGYLITNGFHLSQGHSVFQNHVLWELLVFITQGINEKKSLKECVPRSLHKRAPAQEITERESKSWRLIFLFQPDTFIFQASV